MAYTDGVLTYKDATDVSRSIKVRVNGASPFDILPGGLFTDKDGNFLGHDAAPVAVRIVSDIAGTLGDTDDDSVAAAQTPLALAITMLHAFNGTIWRRLKYWAGALGVSEQAASGTPTYGVVTVDTTATGVVVKAANASRRRITVVNHGAVDVFIGFDTSLSAANGALLVGVKGASLSFFTTAQIRAICASSQVVGYYEEVLGA